MLPCQYHHDSVAPDDCLLLTRSFVRIKTHCIVYPVAPLTVALSPQKIKIVALKHCFYPAKMSLLRSTFEHEQGPECANSAFHWPAPCILMGLSSLALPALRRRPQFTMIERSEAHAAKQHQ